jgi:uncharacterized protein YbaP (TraB family)
MTYFQKMNHWLLSIIFLSLVVSSCKTSKTTTAATTAENYDLESALLWKIEGKELTQPSYLFGTIHLIDQESFFWPNGVLSALEDAEKVSFEVDLDDMFDMGAAMGMMSKAFMADGKTLKDLYSEADYTLIKNHFEGLGMPMMLLERIKPMFLTVFASGDVELGKGLGDQEGTKSYEMELYSLAQESDKDVSGLETIEYQMSVFDSIPMEVQGQMLLETIKGGDSEDDSFKQMVEMYTTQNINGMVTMMSEEEGIGGFEDILLYTRNRNWIPVIEEKMREAQHFFAVGAGHLGGKDGVIDLLKKQGYTLSPLSHTK